MYGHLLNWILWFIAISKKKKKIGKKASKKAGRAKNAKLNSDDEAIEESDEGDYEDREVGVAYPVCLGGCGMSCLSRWVGHILFVQVGVA